MVNRGNDHLVGLKATLGAKADGTVPTLPTRLLAGNDERLELGGVAVPTTVQSTPLFVEIETVTTLLAGAVPP